MFGIELTDNLSNQSNGASVTFGLNQGYKLQSIGVVAVGQAGNEKPAGVLEFVKGDSVIKKYIFSPERIFANGNELQPESKEYKEQYAIQARRISAFLSELALCYMPLEVLKKHLAKPIKGFDQFILTIEKAIKAVPNWNELELDIFLQYQWSIRQGSTRTFLELPSATGTVHGHWVAKSDGKTYKPLEGKKLIYVNEEGNKHPFQRTDWFMNSNFAKLQQIEKSPETAIFGNTEAGSESDDVFNW